MKINIDRVDNFVIVNPKTIRIEKLEFRWRVTINDSIEFTVESAEQLPEWIITHVTVRPVGWTRIITVSDQD